MKKKIAVIVAILAVCMSFCGCSESILNSSGSNDTSGTTSEIWTAKDDDIIAWAEGENLSEEDKEYYNVTFKEFFGEYSFTLSNYGFDETNPVFEPYCEQIRQTVIDMLTNERIILKKAKEMGLDTLTEDEMKEVEKAYLENVEGWCESFEDQAKEELGIESSDTVSETLDTATEQQVKDKAKEIFRDYMEGFGLSEETFLKWQTTTFIERKVLNEINKDIKVEREDAKKVIESTIEEAKKAYDTNVSQYEQNAQYQTVWVPEGTRNIKYILVALSSADSAELNAERNESGADDEEIDKKRDEKLKEIEDKANAAYEKLQNGTSFDDVLKEYSNEYSPDAASQEVTVIKGSTTLNKDLYDAVYTLENKGDISPLVKSDRGYYIIQYSSDAEITDEELDEIIDETQATILESLQNQNANKTLAQWREEVVYEYDYDKLNFEKPEEETSSAESSKEESEEEESEEEESEEESEDNTTTEE